MWSFADPLYVDLLGGGPTQTALCPLGAGPQAKDHPSAGPAHSGGFGLLILNIILYLNQ